MDPMKALNDLDMICSRTPMDREGHAHLLACVSSIRGALAQGCPPETSPVDTGERLGG